MAKPQNHNDINLIKSILGKGTDLIEVANTADSVFDIANLIFNKHASAVLVRANSNKAMGIITEYDVIHAIRKHGEGIMSMKAGDVMAVDLVCCRPSDTLEEALRAMNLHKIRCLPVVSESGNLEGFVNINDVVRGQMKTIIDAWQSKKDTKTKAS